jgi:hypothetical protein
VSRLIANAAVPDRAKVHPVVRDTLIYCGNYHSLPGSAVRSLMGTGGPLNPGGSGIANHSWNAIYPDDEWHLCDATWSGGFIAPEQKNFIKQFNDAYFLTSPALFALNHHPLDSAWILLKDKPTLQAFLNGPLVYKSAVHYKVLPIFPKTFHIEAIKGKNITFRFMKESNLKIEKVEFRIVQQTTSASAYPITY